MKVGSVRGFKLAAIVLICGSSSSFARIAHDSKDFPYRQWFQSVIYGEMHWREATCVPARLAGRDHDPNSIECQWLETIVKKMPDGSCSVTAETVINLKFTTGDGGYIYKRSMEGSICSNVTEFMTFQRDGETDYFEFRHGEVKIGTAPPAFPTCGDNIKTTLWTPIYGMKSDAYSFGCSTFFFRLYSFGPY